MKKNLKNLEKNLIDEVQDVQEIDEDVDEEIEEISDEDIDEDIDEQSEIDRLLSENTTLLAEVEKLVSQLAEEQRKFQILEKNQLFEKIILQLGGRNTKAILALIDEDLAVIEESDFIKAVKSVEKSDPYLFSLQEEKIGGTGFKNSKSNKKNIANAFKSGLGI